MTQELTEPGRGGGLKDVLKNRFLLRLIVRQEMRVRYRGSLLGLLWTYLKPGTQFAVYYVALGSFLKVGQVLPHFAVYLYSGLIIVNFFNEGLTQATRSVVASAPLVKKIYFPRELFPVATTYVAAIHLLPQIVILLVGCLLAGWTPSLAAVAAVALGFSVMAVLVTGLGLVLASLNVYFRDFENLVELAVMVLLWTAPVLYPWANVRGPLGSGLALQIYLANPLTVAAQLFQRAFWAPTVADADAALIPDLLLRGIGALAVSMLVLYLGQRVFTRLEGRFAQEL